MQANSRTDDVEGDPDRVDPYPKQGKVACGMFLVLLVLSFLVIGIVTGLNFSNKPQSDGSRGLLSDGNTTIPFQGPCSNGWISNQNSCYFLVNAQTTWDLSKSLCQDYGAHMMVVNSEGELEFLSRHVHPSTDYWIGLKWDKTEKWTWVNGEEYHSIQNFWDRDYHGDEESCVYLRGTKLFSDADCNSKRYFICEHILTYFN